MKKLKFDKTQILEIKSAQGLSAALSKLHQIMEEVEHESVEGINGFDPDLVSDLKELRQFSRELWEMR